MKGLVPQGFNSPTVYHKAILRIQRTSKVGEDSVKPLIGTYFWEKMGTQLAYAGVVERYTQKA